MSCEKFIELSLEEQEQVKLYNHSLLKNVKILPKNYVLPRKILTDSAIIRNFEVRSDDVWLFGFPRSGTTLTQEIVWLIGNDLNYEKAAKTVMDVRFPFLETPLFRNEENTSEYFERNKDNSVEHQLIKDITKSVYSSLIDMKERRFIKTHLPFSFYPKNLLETGCKVVSVVRNPKDVIVSDYHFPSSDNNSIDFETYWNLFKKNLVLFSPYFEHLKEGWAHRNHKNVLFMFYEDIIKDKRAAIIKIANFLDKKLTDEQIIKLQEHVDIKKFKDNKSVNNDHLVDLGLFKKDETFSFIRSGKMGEWRKYFTGNLETEVNEWIAQNLKGTDIVLPEV